MCDAGKKRGMGMGVSELSEVDVLGSPTCQDSTPILLKMETGR
jgi:hypothetical protein